MQTNKNVVIIGGGPCGIEAAKAITSFGHTVFLIEKEDHLGGNLSKWDRLFPEGVSASNLVNQMTNSMENVKWFVNTNIVSINRLNKSFNIILSNGISIIADALLLTTGFSLFPAEKKEEYGYGIYNRVITNADLEHFFATGSDERIDNPKNIGFVHCVGSRDEKAGNRHCSKVCCATAVKQACEIKEIFPDADVYCFYMDLRMFGRHYEDMYLEAQKRYGIRFIRGRVSEVAENKENKLIIKAEDTLIGKPIKVTLDLLVLMSGMVKNDNTDKIVKMLSLSTDEDGFLKGRDYILSPNISYNEGVFYAGACTGPKTLPETLSEARSAAFEINNYLTINN